MILSLIGVYSFFNLTNRIPKIYIFITNCRVIKLTTSINTYSTIILDKFSIGFHNMVQSLSYEFQVVYHKMDNS